MYLLFKYQTMNNIIYVYFFRYLIHIVSIKRILTNYIILIEQHKLFKQNKSVQLQWIIDRLYYVSQ